MAADRIYWRKAFVQNRYVLEMTIHDVGRSNRYPDGLKYGLICLDQKTGRRVLMDNHHPKGPHIHLDDQEVPYEFADIDQLVEDFRQLVFERFGVRL